MKAVTMVSRELHPFHTRGGTAYAIRRLADQLTGLGIETRVLLPDLLDAPPGSDVQPLLKPILLEMPPGIREAPRLLQHSELCRAALETIERTRAGAPSDAVVAHSDEGAMFIILRADRRSSEPAVFWLHSLWDPRIDDLAEDQRRRLPCQSLLASAVTLADVVVTSTGVLEDATEIEWPAGLAELQKALAIAASERRVLTLEAMGCLPASTSSSEERSSGSTPECLKGVPSPYVLFPGRPVVDKGFGLFAAIAEKLREHDVACVAVERPARQGRSTHPSGNHLVHWLPWLTQDELLVVMRNAACTVLPSITEGFGLAAAESISQGVPTLYQEVGGHRGLHAFPNGMPVPLTTAERTHLYSLWSELLDTHTWSVWSRYEKLLGPVVDKWVEAIRSVVERTHGGRGRIESAHFPEPPVEERWGNRLRRRIELGADAQT